MTNAATTRDRSFPLIALFQLSTCVAAVLACIDFDALRKAIATMQSLPITGWEPKIAALPAAALSGLVLGVALGGGGRRTFREACWCGVVGSGAGLVIALACVTPASLERPCTAGMVVCLATMAMRWRAP